MRLALIAFTVRLRLPSCSAGFFLRRRTLDAPIVLHATYNAIPIVLVALGTGVTAS